MKLVFHGKLRELYGDSVNMAGDTPADVIEGFFSQQPDHPRDLLMEVVGFDTDEKLYAPTDATELHIMPAMYGGGGDIGKILLGVALIAAAFILPAIGVALSSAMVVSMISLGASLALQGVMGIFFRAPTTSKESDPPASKYLGIQENTIKQGTPITVACGRTLIAGHWLSLQSDADKLAVGKFPTNPT